MSRVTTVSTIDAGILKLLGTLFTMDNDIKALAISSLSAIGSSTVPNSVIWLRLLAMPPSMASVNTAIANITRAMDPRYDFASL